MAKLSPLLLENRYGAKFDLPEPVLDRGNLVLETLLAHRSVRSYDTRSLEPGILELIVAAAESAPTSSNLHTYSIIAVEDQHRKREFAALCGDQQHISDAPLFFLFCADLARLKFICESVGGPSTGLDYAEMFIMAVVDATLAAQNLVVAAESLGLGTCYIGGARNHPAKIAELLNLPPKVFVTFGLTVGYPLSNSESVKPRYPQNHGILHRERYDANYQPALLEYEDIMKKFNASQTGRNGRGWIAPTAKRSSTPEGLMEERRDIKKFLAEIGLDIL